MLSAIIFAFNITAPNLILMASGFLLKQKCVIDAGFVVTASDIVFKVALPCLLFLSVLNSDIHFYAQLDLLLAGVCTTFLLYFLAEIYAKTLPHSPCDTWASKQDKWGYPCGGGDFGDDGQKTTKIKTDDINAQNDILCSPL